METLSAAEGSSADGRDDIRELDTLRSALRRHAPGGGATSADCDDLMHLLHRTRTLVRSIGERIATEA